MTGIITKENATNYAFYNTSILGGGGSSGGSSGGDSSINGNIVCNSISIDEVARFDKTKQLKARILSDLYCDSNIFMKNPEFDDTKEETFTANYMPFSSGPLNIEIGGLRRKGPSADSYIAIACFRMFPGVLYRNQIKELPPLTNEIKTIYQELFKDYKDGVGEIISDYAYSLAEEATKAGLDSEPYSHKFKVNVTTVYETVNDFSKLRAVREMSSRYFDELLKQINADAIAKQAAQMEVTEDVQTEVKPVVRELDFVKPANICDKQILETEEDVDAYINKLSEELKSKIRNNKKIKLQ